MVRARQDDGLLKAAFFSILVTFTFIAFVEPMEAIAQGSESVSAREILQLTGVQGGMVVHLGCGDGKLTAALRVNDSYVVHGLDTDPENVTRARKQIRSLGLYGPVSVEQWNGTSLPYTSNLINLFVSEQPVSVPMEEVMRVLCPNGVAYVK